LEIKVLLTGLVLVVNWRQQNYLTDLLRCKSFRYLLNTALKLPRGFWKKK